LGQQLENKDLARETKRQLTMEKEDYEEELALNSLKQVDASQY
jgi:hypothetical protein